MNWYCYRTLHKKEKVASHTIKTRFNHNVFCPFVSKQIATYAGKKRITEAMFPCYSFVQLPSYDYMQELRFLCGVSGLLHLGTSDPIVPDYIIAEIKQQLDPNHVLHLDPVESMNRSSVVVNSGVLRGQIGCLIAARSPKDRVVLLMDFFNRTTPVQIASSCICASSELSA